MIEKKSEIETKDKRKENNISDKEILEDPISILKQIFIMIIIFLLILH